MPNFLTLARQICRCSSFLTRALRYLLGANRLSELHSAFFKAVNVTVKCCLVFAETSLDGSRRDWKSKYVYEKRAFMQKNKTKNILAATTERVKDLLL